MATSKSIEIPNPARDTNTYMSIRRGLYNSGFGAKRRHEDAKLLSMTKYWWNSYTISIVNGPTVTIPAGHFFAYVYSIPNYVTNKKTVVVEQGLGKGYYDDSIDDMLGGERITLGA